MASNKALVPEAKEALERFKMEAAAEVDVNLHQKQHNITSCHYHYNHDMSSYSKLTNEFVVNLDYLMFAVVGSCFLRHNDLVDKCV